MFKCFRNHHNRPAVQEALREVQTAECLEVVEGAWGQFGLGEAERGDVRGLQHRFDEALGRWALDTDGEVVQSWESFETRHQCSDRRGLRGKRITR